MKIAKEMMAKKKTKMAMKMIEKMMTETKKIR